MIINSYQTYLDLIESNCKNKKLYLSTYGFDISTQIERILNKSSSFKILVGVYERFCYPDCEHCKINIANNKAKLLSYQQEFGKDRIIGVDQLHKKIAIMNNTVIIGGFNLTGSQFTDNAILIKSKEVYRESIILFDKQFNSLNKTILLPTNNDIVNFGKYRGKSIKLMQADKRYVNYMRSVLDPRAFAEKFKMS